MMSPGYDRRRTGEDEECSVLLGPNYKREVSLLELNLGRFDKCTEQSFGSTSMGPNELMKLHAIQLELL